MGRALSNIGLLYFMGVFFIKAKRNHMEIGNIIVFLMVFFSAVFIIRRYFRRFMGQGQCGCGCSSKGQDSTTCPM